MKKWHLLTLLGKYQTVFFLVGKNVHLSIMSRNPHYLEKRNCSLTLWGMRNRLSYPNKIVECRSVGESRLRNSKSEQTISSGKRLPFVALLGETPLHVLLS